MRDKLRILHAADLHMDSPFEALGPEKAAQRRGEQRELLEALADLAKESGAELLLLAGDLLDSDSAYAETAELLGTALGRLEIPVFIAPGNHDFYSRRSPYSRMRPPQNVHIFRSPSIGCVPMPALGVRVWGAGYDSPSCPPLLRGVTAEKEPDVLDILLLHGETGRPESPYCPVAESELARSGMDYAALGHIHAFSGLRRAGNCFYAWPGCPEGRGFDERGEKGVILAELAPGACELRFVPLGGRRYEVLTVRVGDNPLADVPAALPEGTARDIYRIVLTGECDAPPDIPAITRALEERFFALTVRDRTVPRRDIWERAGEDSLHGLFLRRLRALYDKAEDEAGRAAVVMAVRAGISALEGGEEP
jgi:DNA repair exonuclease SbcCD nuclease subunit